MNPIFLYLCFRFLLYTHSRPGFTIGNSTDHRITATSFNAATRDQETCGPPLFVFSSVHARQTWRRLWFLSFAYINIRVTVYQYTGILGINLFIVPFIITLWFTPLPSSPFTSALISLVCVNVFGGSDFGCRSIF